MRDRILRTLLLTFWLLVLPSTGPIIAQNLAGGDPGTGNLKVMTWNIEGGHHCESTRDMSKASKVIRRYNPDVIVIQEIHRLQALQLANDLALDRNYDYWFVEAKSCGRGEDDDDFGLAIFSVYPIIPGSKKVYALTEHPEEKKDGEHRKLIRGIISVGDQLVRIYNTHLTSKGGKEGGDRFRSLQVKDILDAVALDESMANQLFQPILMGDFNMEDTSSAYEKLKDRFNDTWAIWVQHHGDLDNPKGWTNPTVHLRHRIDYIFTGKRDGIGIEDVRVPDVTTVLHDYRIGSPGIKVKDLPDHIPVIASLRLR